MLHGGLTDDEQQEIVDSFKLETSPIRVLVTGDVASEGVNLHAQCHNLIHYDIPWSLPVLSCQPRLPVRIQARQNVDDAFATHRSRCGDFASRRWIIEA